MTIHHDKLAYGKLAKQSEELSEERLAQMLEELSENKEKDGGNADGRNKKEEKSKE